MRFQLLGPLEIHSGGRQVPVAADKQRTVVATLLAARSRAVPVADLVNEIWGAHLPTSAIPNLRTYVMRLRRGDPELAGRLTTAPAGYLLRVEPDELDVRIFEDATEAGRRAMAQGDARTAARAFDHALAQWRGGALQDVPLGRALNEFAQAMEEQFARAVEDHATAALALGEHREVVDRLRPFVERHPLRERAYARLMLAFYRCGDVHGAIRVFHRARDVLREELGIDPGSELCDLLQSVLGRAPELDASQPGPRGAVSRPVPRQLPPSPALFVGRAAELGRATAALHTGPGPAVVAIHGTGGLGKSALALRAAHAIADRFPDGQLYADLQGARPGLPPLPSHEALNRFLRALGVDRHRLPQAEAEAAALLQSLLADRRVLVLLDNASDASQVRPLLPAGRGCATLITSRTVLGTLDAQQVGLGELGHGDVVRALARQAGEARVAREPEAVGAVARACAGNALAVRIVGARLAERPDLPIARLGERLRRLAEWRAGDLDLRACFEASYETLPATAATALRLLAARGPADLGVGPVAALLGSDAPTAEAALDELVRARLLDAEGERSFRMHRLVRLYAAELPSAEPRATRTAMFAHGV
ncbi:AfsR/SARP family transcriptional regulator [Streptomyces sp. AC550_RSS872]|uniref:AfsR/SARP family transcriptional regulator n=1 Tax=Streptomyces sp. AC550_RSS872 TaxID=2823689 RepID=UPI001C27AC93|nr:AfsR/SARP family transcriptional regulator [Streptomyces sp. AC550_RSS872]